MWSAVRKGLSATVVFYISRDRHHAVEAAGELVGFRVPDGEGIGAEGVGEEGEPIFQIRRALEDKGLVGVSPDVGFKLGAFEAGHGVEVQGDIDTEVGGVVEDFASEVAGHDTVGSGLVWAKVRQGECAVGCTRDLHSVEEPLVASAESGAGSS